MSSSEVLKCGLRDKVGSRDARKLRSQGRIPASIQAEGKSVHLNIHLAADAFHSSRRHHVHLYDLDVDGDVHTAVVREMQWDVMGDYLNHIEFRPVQRGVAIESQVSLVFHGQVKDAVLSQNVTEITISCIPSLIPDNLEVEVDGLEVGVHLHASDIILPEGITLAVDPEFEIAVVGQLKVVVEEELAVDVDPDAVEIEGGQASEGGEAAGGDSSGDGPDEGESSGD
ncbi:MAG TPA: 50S ribosomal protein L25 [Planctomycetes bacterium]|nr:50S ribosomal protein L25 [Planctomycetota bacterium]HIK61506.1 50S ribosomal protein L25 [Planctomycetota bacterium]